MGLLRASLYPASQVKTQLLLEMLLSGVDQQMATTLTDPSDGPDGWSTLEIICHLRDFEKIWQQRMRLVLEQDNPELPVFDEHAVFAAGNYLAQDFATVWAERTTLRAESQALIDGIAEADWDRTGEHREYGLLTLAEIRFQLALHDLDHAEQLARVLRKA